MDANPSPAPPRGRFSLLVGPWHTSSRVVAAVVLVFLVLCNIPGQEVARLRFGNLPPVVADIRTDVHLEHGWPLTYLARPHDALRTSPEIRLRDCFALWQHVAEFHWTAALANVATVLMFTMAIGIGFEAWRRAHTRLTQIHVRDLLAVLLVVSVSGAWFLNKRHEYSEQNRILRDDHQPIQSNYADGQVTWLRLLFGDGPFGYVDRPVAVTVFERGGWAQLEKFPTVRHVDGYDIPSAAEVGYLSRLPNLESLSLSPPDFLPRTTLELPELQRVRGLQLSHLTSIMCRRIDRATSLEVISIANSRVDDQTFQEIQSLPEIRELSLNGVELTADRLTVLSTLPKLRALELAHTGLDDDMVLALRKFPQLTWLSLRGCAIAKAELHALASLKSLETLDLSGTGSPTSKDIAPLANLPNLRELYVAGTLVDRQAIEHLVKLRQLRLLALPRRGFSEADEKLLRQSLPLCEIHFER